MTPEEYCQQKAAQSGSSFYYSFLFLAPERRRAITALYAFCREVDDIADDVQDPGVARAKLAWWRTEITDMFTGHPQHPVGKALLPFIGQFNLEQARFGEIIDGMEMDLTHHRYADFKLLELYCYRVASVVGLLSAQIFGYRDRRTLSFAQDLGTALQLINIIRDVGEDARRNRIYLPQDELQRFGVDSADLRAARHTDNFQQLMTFQAERAKDFYARALAQLPPEDRKTQRAGLVMGAIYRTLLNEIERDGFHVLTQRIALTPIRKLWIASKTWVDA
jgi:phytoene synthase